jgi:protein TonB
MAFLSKNIKYPPVCVSEEASGRVYMQFVVEKDGEICQIRVLFSLPVKFGLK